MAVCRLASAAAIASISPTCTSDRNLDFTLWEQAVNKVAASADCSAISRAVPPVTQPPQEKPTTVARTADPAQAQNSTVLLARY